MSTSRAPVTFLSIGCRFRSSESKIAELRSRIITLVIDEMPRGTHDVNLAFPEVVREGGRIAGEFLLALSMPDGIGWAPAMQTVTKLSKALLPICDGKPEIRMK